MPKVFISYRRADSSPYTGRLFDRMVEAFAKDKVFMDVDSIEPGVDFDGLLRKSVASCDLLLAVIGPQWLNVQGADGKRRLDNEDDIVRHEIPEYDLPFKARVTNASSEADVPDVNLIAFAGTKESEQSITTEQGLGGLAPSGSSSAEGTLDTSPVRPERQPRRQTVWRCARSPAPPGSRPGPESGSCPRDSAPWRDREERRPLPPPPSFRRTGCVLTRHRLPAGLSGNCACTTPSNRS